MKLNKLKASFGLLQGESLAPGVGLNIIYAPNEGGKSTWCAFVRAMLYGIDTRERDTKNSLAEKNRWQPWSGAPMEGEAALTWRGRELVLRRFAKGNIPFGGFSAVDAVTGEEMVGFSGDTAGETLLGVSRGVYERSAFIGQGAISFTGEQELEKRIAALVSSGEENVSYSQVEGRLREWQRRRKHNKTGLIPRLEGQLAELDDTLERLERAHRQADTARRELERLELRKKQLETEHELHRRLAQKELDRRCSEAMKALNEAKEREETLRAEVDTLRADGSEPYDARFPGMTPDEAWRKSIDDAAEVEKLGRRRSGVYALSTGLFSGALWAFILWIGAPLRYGNFGPVFGITAAVLALAAVGGFLWNHSERKKRKTRRAGLLSYYAAATADDILACATTYRGAWAKADETKRTAEAALSAAIIRREGAKRLLDALAESGGRPSVTLEVLAVPECTPAETSARLANVRGELSRLGGDMAMARGEMNTLGNPAALAARREGIREELTRRKIEYDALTLALEELASANAELQARFSPVLNARAGELMAGLTGGKYDRITLTRDFQAMAGETGGVLPRRAMTLSQGTADQLYLAVRLAVCLLALPEDDLAPLVLDDALASFDNERMALALALLRELGKTRQILLFTCHRREGDCLAHASDVTHINLQS